MRIIVALIVVLLTGCSSAPVGKVGQDQAAVAPGKKIYKRKCRNCHLLIKPDKHDDSSWVEILDQHKERFTLSDDDREKVLLFLTSHN